MKSNITTAADDLSSEQSCTVTEMKMEFDMKFNGY